jgi:transcription elongation factor GreB
VSRAFVKEDADQEGVLVPARAPLPDGVPNRVTRRGLALLEAERDDLTAERHRLQAEGGDDARRTLEALAGRLDALQDRLLGARLEEPDGSDVVAFGTIVTVTTLRGPFTGETERFAIVGVDEAQGADDLVAFTAPIAQALLGLRTGDRADMKAGRGVRELEVVAVEVGGNGEKGK